MAGVSSRTLRHYDEIGLLKPAWTGPGGRRHYERPELVRLQEIVLLRELGLGLDDIGRILGTGTAEGAEGGADRRQELSLHLERLRGERDRLNRMIEAVEGSLAAIEHGEPMNAEAMFDGFAANPYEAEARERWGDEIVDESKRRLREAPPESTADIESEFERIHDLVRELFRAGHRPDADDTQAVIADHHALIQRFWAPDPDAYRNLGRMYVEDKRFRENIGEGDDGMVEYLSEAMSAYADRLTRA